MNWTDTKAIAVTFCQTDRGTVQSVREYILPRLTAEADLLENCDRQYVEAGLPSIFTDDIADLRQRVDIGRERLQAVAEILDDQG